LKEEENRQKNLVDLSLTGCYSSKTMRECLMNTFVTKYSEGYPGKRYYSGTKLSDVVERLAHKRILDTFQL
jgi:glycine hydroxymethyltransferase